ncbi:MAG TPA: ABC transporter substrate-binding protein, partial [Acidimicrobiales bacterium]|nr:ABC transporter substrate-binding protein [Acidimicrobiales bacterium]
CGTSGSSKQLAAAPGFDPVAKTIHVGIISALTGPVALIGKPLTAGNELWFNHVNQDLGGIGGKYKIVFDEEDSQYVPQNGVQAYNKLKDNEVLIAQLLGTPVTKAVLPLLKQDNVVASPASLDADWVRDPNLLPVEAPYQIQMINAASYLVNDLGMKGKTFCEMIQDDSYGEAGKAGVDYAAAQLGFTVKSLARYATPATDLTAQIQQLKQANCDVVFLTSTPTDTGKAFGTAAQLGFAPQWVGQSPSYHQALIATPLKAYLQAHFLLASEGTEWGDRSVKGQADMLDLITKLAPSQAPDGYFGFGYVEGRLVTQILEQAVKDGDLSRAGIQKAMADVGTLTFDGLTGDYKYGAPANREPPRSSTIFRINPAKPIGVEVAKATFVSDIAKTYKIPG